MANRFSSLTQYHQIVLAHGIMAAVIFLLLVPFSVFINRFHIDARPAFARRWHARANIFAGLMLLAVFILGYFAVGPERSLTNPHHGIGVAIFLLFILQLVGGSLVRGIKKWHSFRITLHQWSGRVIAMLGIIQIPLGLTLYGSPIFTFVLFTVWMVFLLLLYFIMDYKRQGREYHGGGRSDRLTGSVYPETDVTSSDGGGKRKWLAPLLAGAGIMALLFRKKNKDRGSRSRSRSRSHSRSRSFSRSRVDAMSGAPTSYFDSEKTYEDDRRKSGGGWMSKLLPLGAALGAFGLANKGRNRGRDDEYSAVSTETPSRLPPRRAHTTSDLSEISDQYRRGPRGPPTAPSMSGVDSVPPGRGPPRRAQSDMYSGLSYDNGSYDSPSRRPTGGRGGGVAKGLLAGLGMGWLANKFSKKKPPPRDDVSGYTYDDSRLDDSRLDDSRLDGSRYTEDPYLSPPRNNKRPPPRRLSKGGRRGSVSHAPTEDSSILESRHGGGVGPPMPPLSHAASPPSAGARGSSRHDIEPVDMPPMPPDPRDAPLDAGLERRGSSRRRRGEEAAAAAAASASVLAAEEDEMRRRDERRGRRGRGSRERDRDTTPTRPPRTTIKMTVHDDRVNLRRLTDDEASKGRRFRRADSESSISEDTPSRRYRRDASQRRAESAAEHAAEEDSHLHLHQPPPPDSPLSPPNPAFASGSRRPKDSAYYSGGGAQQPLVTPSHGAPPVSSIGSGSHGTWSEAVSPSPGDRQASAAENRRRRRQERRRSVSSRPVGADMYD